MKSEFPENLVAENSDLVLPTTAPHAPTTPPVPSGWLPVRKVGSLWAKRLTRDRVIETLEGTIVARAGDFWCRGATQEPWAQTAESLHQKYRASGHIDAAGWERYDPAPDAPALQARQLVEPCSIESRWGRLQGKSGDYLIRRQDDHADLWIVDQRVFELTYLVLNAEAPSDEASAAAPALSPPVGITEFREHESPAHSSPATATERTRKGSEHSERHSA